MALHSWRGAAALLALAAGGALGSAEPALASTYRVLYAPPSGTFLNAEVGAVQSGTVYVVDPNGGTHGQGAIDRLDPSGVLHPLYNFTNGTDGSTPNRRLQITARGALIGTALGGGDQSAGTVFKLSRKGVLTTLHLFQGPTDGAVPRDGLAADASGRLFTGTGSGGGLGSGNGSIFRIGVRGKFRTLYLFQSSPSDGHCPFTGVALDAAGDIFGTTVGMGFGGLPQGSVWEYTAQGGLKTLYAFTDQADGEWPQTTPALDGSGHVWGVSATRSGQPYAGAVWSISGGTFAIQHPLNGGSDGWQPNGPLLLAQDGSFYGTTYGGGSAKGPGGYGVVFRITTAGVYSVVHAFTGGSAGGNPTGGLVQDADGRIYGGTLNGVVFAITP